MAWIHETPYAYSHNTQSISPIDATQSGLVELSTNNEQPRCTDGSHLASVHLSQPTIRISPSESSGHDEPEPKYEDHTHRRQTRHPTIKTEKSLPQRPAYSETSRWSFNSHDRTPIQVPKGWPTEPSRRHTARWVFVLTLLFDIIITIAPVIFIVIAISARALDSRPSSNFGENILRAQKLGPTVFPVLFAAVVGRLMTNVARWKAQQGAALGLLEQLNGSQSLSTAVERVVLLRRYGVVGIAIVILWSLSPVGGQSSLRVLSTRASELTDRISLRYMDTEMTFDDNWGASTLAVIGSTAAAIFQGSLLSSAQVRQSAVDTWTNVKIPMIETVAKSNGTQSSDNPWRTVSQASPFNYSSLIGITIAGLPAKGKTNFTLESSYTRLDSCIFGISKISGRPDKGLGPFLSNNENRTSTDPLKLSGVSAETGGLARNAFPAPFIVDTNARPLSSITNPNLMFVLTAANGADMKAISGHEYANCTTATARVESNVICHGTDCAVTRIRHSLNTTLPPSITPFDFRNDAFIPLSNLLLGFPYIGGVRQSTSTGRQNPVLSYLNDSSSTIFSFPSRSAGYAFSQTTPAEFIIPFTQLWNTFLQCFWAPTFISGGAPQDLAEYDRNDYLTAGIGYSLGGRYKPFPNRATTASRTVEGPRLYVSHNTWVAILLVVSLLMQICAICGTALRYFCHAPSILGHVSSLTRDNPHVGPLPPGGTTLDGLERARLLKGLVVQVGDVRRGEEVGHIALKTGVGEPIGKDKRREYF